MKGRKTLHIKEAFQQTQKPHQNHAKLVTSLKQTYDELQEKSGFHEEFVHYLKYALIIYKREPAVEKVINFVAKFVASLYEPLEDDAEEEETENSLLNYLFNFLLESHNANNNAVRFRVCQLINKLLGSLPENAEIGDKLFDKINSAMLLRVKDKVPNVRIQAVLALSRLQDPKDSDCPVINVYNNLVENDSNAEVRRAVLSCISPCAKTLPKIVSRTMDVKEAVRKLAYQVLAEKVHIKALTIGQRVKLLQQGLNDRSDPVKEVVQKKLLQAWLRLAEGNVLELLHWLDVESCPEVGVSALNAMFSLSPLNDVIQNFTELDGRKVIPIEKLTAESALFWKILCEYLKSQKEEEFLESVLPEPAVYADYLLSYIQNVPVLSQEEKEDMTCLDNLMTRECIGQQLILMLGCMDTSEEGGRKKLLTVLQKILMTPTTSAFLVPSLTENLLQILKDDDRRIQTVAEIISEVREEVITVDKPSDPTEIRKQQLQLAEVKVKLMETKDALEKCVALQDFNQASVLKERITELESKKSDLLKEAEQPQTKEICMEKNDPETLLKCLIMCNELLKQLSSSKGLGPTLDGIIESLIIPGVTNIHPAVRNMAVLCLSCCALQSKDFASQHLALLLQVLQIDEIKIKFSALKGIFDQLMTFGIEPFKANKEGNSHNENDKDDNETIKETEHNLLQLISGFLDSEFSELRTVSAEGLAKLMFIGRLSSAKLLSRLILLWYNPVTEEDNRLRHSLGVFFPLFAYSNRANQECFEEAFLPTLHILFNAPVTSPLSEVDISNVAELLVDLTRPSGLNLCTKNTQNYPGLTAHDNLALKLCNEILKDPTAPDVRIYTKSLSSLELNKDFSKDLLVLLDEVHEKVKDKACLRMIEKVKSNLNGGNPLNGDISGVSQESNSSQVSRDTGGTIIVHDSDRTSDPNDQSEEANKETAPPTEETENTATKSRSVRSKAVKGAREIQAKTVPRRRACRTADSGSESEEVHQAVSVTSSRPSRRAKTAALGKTRKNLSHFLDTE
ncbi:condensin complex subunit 3 isoform X2 [Anolis carolinensis]|uniref:Non-SMC condensin I complex subunit G n=1 Tax=Anolis carolinensis TaxID=28377 RepID=G1KAA5_ANOCA|nr:PREDICTED: condensin complex subunit 3 isoform X2 [Anolis carolinensis]|eukprot:XP_008109506.1 PREDICTED: condensin complex subunit 3 isoform X2 [Anolis carolinensis]